MAIYLSKELENKPFSEVYTLIVDESSYSDILRGRRNTIAVISNKAPQIILLCNSLHSRLIEVKTVVHYPFFTHIFIHVNLDFLIPIFRTSREGIDYFRSICSEEEERRKGIYALII